MSEQMIGGGRPMRTCTGCGCTDDHPRHVVVLDAAGTEHNYHLRCHAAAGCAICAAQIAGAKHKTGAAQLAHLLAHTEA